MTINPNTAEAYQLFHDGILTLQRAEQQGMRIDLEHCYAAIDELNGKIDSIEKDFKATAFYKHWDHVSKTAPNIYSDKQLGYYLYNVKKITPFKTTKSGQGSTDKEALSALKIPELDLLLESTKYKTMMLFIDGFIREQVKGILHPQFRLDNVITFRSSSNSPNFQNIPKRDEYAMKLIRDCIYPRQGNQLMEIDFKGVEVSVSACYNKDPMLIKYLTTPGTDMHGDMAQQIFILDTFDKHNHEDSHLRKAAKNGFVFPQFYGDYYRNNAIGLCQWVDLPQGAWKTAMGCKVADGQYISNHMREKGIKSFEQFVSHLQQIEDDFWQRRFKVYAKWKDRTYAEYLRNGFADSYTGFRFNGEMNKKEVTNYPIQGAAFHCLLWCLIRLDQVIREKGWNSRIIGQIHDAIVLDIVPEELYKVSKMIKRITTVELAQAWKWIIVPLDVEAELGDIDGSWATVKEYKLP